MRERERESGLASTCCTPHSVSSPESVAQPWSAMATVLVEKAQRGEVPSVKEGRDVESDIAEETMSAVVKFAKKICESCDVGQPTAECQLMRLSRRKLVTQRCELRPAAEDTEERVLALQTEMCEKSEVTSVEEGHNVERRCGATSSRI